MKEIIYVVVAHRYGNKELHSYIVGVFSSPEDALKAAVREEEFRGGKYICSVLEIEKEKHISMKGWETIKDVSVSDTYLEELALLKQITTLESLMVKFKDNEEVKNIFSQEIANLERKILHLK